MKNKILFLALILVLSSLTSCMMAPQDGGGYPGPQTGGYNPYGGQPSRGYPQHGGPNVAARNTGYQLGPVLHERWKYDSKTGKTVKVSENVLTPEQAKAEMVEKGLDPFPDRIPVGGEMPEVTRTSNREELEEE